MPRFNVLAIPFSLALVAGSVLVQPARAQLPVVTLTPEGTEFAISITPGTINFSPPGTQELLVGYLGFEGGTTESRFYGAVFPAVQYSITTAQQLTTALTGAGGTSTTVGAISTGPFEMPASAALNPVVPFAQSCTTAGFTMASSWLAQGTTTGMSFSWLPISPQPLPAGFVPWGEAATGGPQGPNFMNQESVARFLIVNQYAAIGQPIAGSTATDVNKIIALASSTAMRLNMLSIEVTPSNGEFSAPQLVICRSYSIPFSPSTQPGGFVLSFPNGEHLVYPGTPEIPVKILLAEPLHSAALLANWQIQLPGGGLATNLQGDVGSPALSFTIPASATSGLFSVRNVVTNELVLLAGPTAPSLVAELQRIYLD